jgi:hypothetical protein
MQEAAKYEALKPQSTPVFESFQMGVEFSPLIRSFIVNFRIA